VGMDVVRNEILAIGGRIETATIRGKGTTFTIYLPLTLAVAQAVLVRGGGDVFAISSAIVEQVLRLKPDALSRLYERGTVESQGHSYPLCYVRHLVGSTDAAPELHNYNSVLLLRSGIQRTALHVDELLRNQEIVIKNIGPQLSRVPGITGATVLGDGRIVLIINPVQLAQRTHGASAAPAIIPEPVSGPPAARVVMVVDDSLTVRKITGRLLEREGYRVLAAKDGLDALEQLKETLPDVMLVDIEMPRMDGFDLTRNVRNDPRTSRVPIIIISSRTAEKHRSHALELGVNAFLGKPYQETELLQQITQQLGTRPTIH
jgi:chemosensory pili system protein ChpA (sensor histidine kinase/response regulator)